MFTKRQCKQLCCRHVVALSGMRPLAYPGFYYGGYRFKEILAGHSQ